ncbi:GDSL-like Lipase/Acylhydrolase [Colletotrichum tofieldiae]|uniref:GDSL-like Lipase/Acylhydrolase n=1 Tax=Colletotrichum tofieldiae TaxID=708197 RepID=A0A166PC79_9PEZI|nr:GDSL-like Lipase/Acylhydrolase [Colletotrichum tofieldiae]GKT74201.1 GDSL-like Lipase/Acylhydrolase [Colletotrichum tofieldiae]GKT97075.1 GDSL-like lipase/acylhydrolase [Colletotrichum tofieldiae]
MRFSIASAAALVTPLALAAADALEYKSTPAGQVIKDGVKLRILPVGDSITVGFASSDGNGYRLKLDENLSANDVVFAGTVTSGNLTDGYFAGWSGRTIQYIADNVGPSLEQRPNVILLHAGTNDMNPNPDVSKEGNDPAGAAARLGCLIDQMITACPDATVLVAQIVNTCDVNQRPATEEFQKLIPGVVEQRRNASHHVLAVDFAALGDAILRPDCIHPSDEGYRTMGDYWYDFIAQIPKDWINQPVGSDPDRPQGGAAANADKTVSGSASAATSLFKQKWLMPLTFQAMVTLMIMNN